MVKTITGKPHELAKRLESLRSTHNVAGSAMIGECSYYAPQLRIVEINPDPTAQEVVRNDNGLYSLLAPALRKFQLAGGIEFPANTTQVRRDETNPDVVRATVAGKRIDSSGMHREEAESAEVVLSVRAEHARNEYAAKVQTDPQYANMQEAERKTLIERQVKEAVLNTQQHSSSIAVTMAKSRAILKMLGLKSGYTEEEIRRPFVVVAMVPDLPKDNPAVAAAVALGVLGIKQSMYPTGVGIPAYGAEASQDVPETSASDAAVQAYTAPVAPAKTSAPAADRAAAMGFNAFPRLIRHKTVIKLARKRGRVLTDDDLKTLSDADLAGLYNELAEDKKAA